MSVRFAVLGLLKEEPDYGYRIKRRFDERVGEMWQLNLGQVYQTLQSLEDIGLIARGRNADSYFENGPARVCFRLTPLGEQALDAWLRKRPRRPQPVRDELLIRLLLLEPARRDEAVERVKAQQRMYHRLLVELQRRKRSIPRDGESELVARLGIEAGIAHTYAHLKWLEYCQSVLDGHADATLDLGVEQAETARSVPQRA